MIGQLNASSALTHSKNLDLNWAGSLWGPRCSFAFVEERKSFISVVNRTRMSQSSIPSLATILTDRSRVPFPGGGWRLKTGD
jgi:hypothetical protein